MKSHQKKRKKHNRGDGGRGGVSRILILKRNLSEIKWFVEFFLEQKKKNDFESCDCLLSAVFVRDVFVASESYG